MFINPAVITRCLGSTIAERNNENEIIKEYPEMKETILKRREVRLIQIKEDVSKRNKQDSSGLGWGAVILVFLFGMSL